MAQHYRNPDQALLHRFRDAPGAPLPIEASPFAMALSGHIAKVDAEAGRVELRFTPGPMFLQGADVVQGGVVSAMIDFAMAFAGLAMLPANRVCATTTLNVAFLRPARPATYVAVGEIERMGRQVGFARGHLAEAGRPPVATGAASLAVIELGADRR
ncbi:MAG: PaaI family thioesterase [Alphaproteobacteria bacterium]